MKILVTGGEGQVGFELKQYPQVDHDIIALPHTVCDITNIEHLEKHLQFADCIVNAAAYTAVDDAEVNPEIAEVINHVAAKNIAKICCERKIPLIHLSTDFVFDGLSQIPYKETDKPEPISVYGSSKLKGENAVFNANPHAVILRTSGLFSSHGNNFVKTILKLAKQRNHIDVVNDQILSPTPASDLARVLFEIFKQWDNRVVRKQYGLYHYCAHPPVSWYQFAKIIVGFANELTPLAVKSIHGISSDSWKSAAKRPHYSVLNCEKIHENLGIQQRSWQPALQQVIHKVIKENE